MRLFRYKIMAKKRKIPARKHHGIRDPLKQLEQKEKKLAHVTNNPPAQNSEQHMSFRFKEFKKLADATKRGCKVKRGSQHMEDGPRKSKKIADTSNARKQSNFKQFTNESDEDYLRRINRVTNAAVREAQYEAKYGVNVIHNPKTGEIMMRKRPPNEIDMLLNQKKKPRSSSSGTKSHKDLIQALTEIKEKNENADNARNSQEFKYDSFKFGEIVHGPPVLTSLPRKAVKNETVPRPGRKANLLLKDIIDGSQKAEKKLGPHPNKTNNNSNTSKPSRKISSVNSIVLENERKKIVGLYRQLKSEREKNKPLC